MKKFITSVLVLTLILTAFGCSRQETISCYAEVDTPEVSDPTDIPEASNPTGDDMPDSAPPDAVLPSVSVAEAESFIITLPDIVTENCDYTVSDDTVIFTMKDGGDYVCEFVCCGAADYSEEFWVYKAAENGPNIVYIAFPTCGTLNNEAIRETLEAVTEAIKTAPVEFK